MRRVVITGIGIISPIGNDAAEVEASLRAGKSGIVFAPDYAERGFRSQVHGTVKIDLEAAVDRRQKRFMGDGAAYCHMAMTQAIADAGPSRDGAVSVTKNVERRSPNDEGAIRRKGERLDDRHAKTFGETRHDLCG